MLIVLLCLSLLVWAIVLIDASLGLKKLDRLEAAQTLTDGPPLSVIVAARNEEKALAASVKSQLQTSYKPIEWILVNDRSTDETGAIMDALQTEDARIKVLHIRELPETWLGKNYALYAGAQQAAGELLLFTDADMLYHQEMIGKAVGYFTNQRLDHLTAAPNLSGKGLWLRAFVAFFLFGFSYYKRPWLANNPRSTTGIGIGAFNLLTKKAYEAAGTHEAIKLRPDDDLMLGMTLKRLGFKQRIVTALELLEVEWYGSLKEALIGLEKNTFAGLHYRISMVLFAIAGTFISQVLPFFTVFVPDLLMICLSAANIILLAVIYTLIINRMTTYSPLLFLLFPLTALLFIYSIIRASFLTFKRGGIVWRGTKYSLRELRDTQK